MFIVFAFMMEASFEKPKTIIGAESVAEASFQQKRMRRRLLQSIQGGFPQLPPVMIAKKQPNSLYEV